MPKAQFCAINDGTACAAPEQICGDFAAEISNQAEPEKWLDAVPVANDMTCIVQPQH